MPLAAFASFTEGDTLDLRAAWGDPDGRLPLVQVRDAALAPDVATATALGERVAARLRSDVLAQGGIIGAPGAHAAPG